MGCASSVWTCARLAASAMRSTVLLPMGNFAEKVEQALRGAALWEEVRRC
jgi:hypothetical protein